MVHVHVSDGSYCLVLYRVLLFFYYGKAWKTWKKGGLRIDRPFEKWTYFSCPLLNSRTLDPKGTFCENTIYSIMERNTFFLEIFDSIRFFGFCACGIFRNFFI